MNEVYLGQIMVFAFDFAPRGWLACNGQLMAINQNSALFSLLGTAFGGDGKTTFALPDLRGRSMISQGQGSNLTPVVMGQIAGTETVTLNSTNMPAHIHTISQQNIQTKIFVTTNGGPTNEPGQGEFGLGAGGNFPSIFSDSTPIGTTDYVGGASTNLNGNTDQQGGNQPLGIRNPYLGMNVCIATQGIFPSRQ
jgi:microcystin-dependent protein